MQVFSYAKGGKSDHDEGTVLQGVTKTKTMLIMMGIMVLEIVVVIFMRTITMMTMVYAVMHLSIYQLNAAHLSSLEVRIYTRTLVYNMCFVVSRVCGECRCYLQMV